MISPITEAVLLKTAENAQPSKLLVIVLSTALFIAVSAVTAVLTYKLKKKKYSQEKMRTHNEIKERENDF